MAYDDAMINSHSREPMIHFFALAGSLPEAAANIYISPDTMRAMVTNVPINMVAERTTSCTKSPTEVASPVPPLMVFLIPKVSYILSLHCPWTSRFSSQLIPIAQSDDVSAREKLLDTNSINISIPNIFFMYWVKD